MNYDLRYKIGQLTPPQLEVFGCALLSLLESGQRYGNVNSTVNGDGATTKGTPDAAALLPSGKYVAVQFSRQRDRLSQKFLGDMEKLTDAKNCKISGDISEVVLCTNRPLPHPHTELHQFAQKHGWRLTIYALDDLVREAAQYPQLCADNLGIQIPGNTVADGHLDRDRVAQEQTFRCGTRLRIARRDSGLSPSEFIQLVGFHSETEYLAIEGNRQGCPSSLVASVSDATGINSSWLTHGNGLRYLPRNEIVLYEVEKDVEIVASFYPQRLVLCMDRWFHHVAVVAEITEHKWLVIGQPFTADLTHLTHGHRHLREVYTFLNQLFERFELEIKIESHILSFFAYQRLVGGKVHPKNEITRLRPSSREDNWADDLRDIYHRFPIADSYHERYGNWFIRAQERLRTAISEEEAVAPFDWNIQEVGG